MENQPLFIHSSIHSFILIHSFGHSFIRSFVRSFILINSFVHPSIHSFIRCSFVRSFIHSSILFLLSDSSCLPPVVSIQNLPGPSDKPSTVAILRSKDFIVQTQVSNSNCNTSNTILFEWYLYKYDVDRSGKTEIKSITLLDSKSTEWNLQKRQLDYGRYFVDFRAAFAGHPHMIGSSVGFFDITKSPLIADISGGNRVTRGKGNIIKLDGSLSRDPDADPSDPSSMQFTWLCKKQQESFPDVPIASLPTVTPSSGPGKGGCFGTGVGKLSSNDVKVHLGTSAMVVGAFYDVKLIVKKDDRKDEFRQIIEIVNGDPPQVAIRLVET